MPYIPYLPCIPNIKHTILSKHAIPDRPYTPYIPNIPYHTPTTPQGGEGDSATTPPHHVGKHIPEIGETISPWVAEVVHDIPMALSEHGGSSPQFQQIIIILRMKIGQAHIVFIPICVGHYTPNQAAWLKLGKLFWIRWVVSPQHELSLSCETSITHQMSLSGHDFPPYQPWFSNYPDLQVLAGPTAVDIHEALVTAALGSIL